MSRPPFERCNYYMRYSTSHGAKECPSLAWRLAEARSRLHPRQILGPNPAFPMNTGLRIHLRKPPSTGAAHLQLITLTALQDHYLFTIPQNILLTNWSSTTPTRFGRTRIDPSRNLPRSQIDRPQLWTSS